ncbi:MAG: Immunoglobulin-like domain of bacterial spore germination [Solirubrobacteraceae bacterium]|jgi:hypothetical protein|nr:Immunoglobulin-like domain of bacterial spore germination [Solirubrobacteraceae bacterium]
MHAIGRLASLVVLLLLAVPGSASALTATNARIAAHPGFVRVVVDFSGGTLQVNDADATDPIPSDGTARVEVRHPGISALAVDRSAAGVRVRMSQAAGRVVIGLESARLAFKYLRVAGLHGPERLVLDLYGAKPPTRAAEIRTGRGGCLSLTSVTADGHGFRVRGVERDLFEGSFVLRVRDARGHAVGRRIMTARGAWSARVAYRVSTAGTGTLEAVAASAKDGSLACLVQVRVGLNP